MVIFRYVVGLKTNKYLSKQILKIQDLHYTDEYHA